MYDKNEFVTDVFADLANTQATSQPPVEGTVGQEPDPALFSTDSDTQTSTRTDTSNADVQVDDSSKVTPEGSQSDDLSWDSFIEEGAKAPAVQDGQIDWRSISTAVGATDEFKAPEDLTNFVETLRKENAELKSRPIIDDNMPSDLRDALEVWKNQGDYHAIFDVDSVDYGQLDPVELFEDEVESHFVSPDGTFREQDYYDYIDSVSDIDKEIRGKQIQRQLIADQQHQKQTIKQRVEKERQENLQNLQSTLNKFEKVGDFSITPKVRQQLFQDIASGTFLSELGVKMNGAHQFDKLLSMYFKAKYFDTIQKFNESRTRSTTLRTEIAKVGNHNLKSTNQLGNPVETQKKDAIDLYFDAKGIKK